VTIQTGFAVALFLLLSANVRSDPSLILNTAAPPHLGGSNLTGFIDRVQAEALRRMGYTLEIVRLPAGRGLQNSNAGLIDGESIRIAGLDKIYPNLVRVDEKIMDLDFVAFSKQNIRINNGWNSLKHHVVSIVNGWKILEKNIPKNTTLTKVKSVAQLFALLEKDRTDLVIYERLGGLAIIADKQYNSMHVIEPPLDTREMYMYLHKKHKALIPELTKILKKMKQDGSYRQIARETLAPYTSKY